MKTLLTFMLLTTAIFAAPIRDATLEWDYPTNELTANISFVLRSTHDIASPMSNWPVRLVISGTNTTVTIPMTNGWQFFYMTASNEWGESLPSNTLTTQVFRAVSNMTIKPK